MGEGCQTYVICAQKRSDSQEQRKLTSIGKQDCPSMSSSNAYNEVAQTRYSLLKSRTQAFCSAFLDLANSLHERIIDENFTSKDPQITEHGPTWARKRLHFLATSFTGREECLQYFKLLGETLEFIPHKETFPSGEGIVVDDQARVSHVEGAGISGVVSVVGQA